MTSGEPLPSSILGQANVIRAPPSPKHEFYTFYCSGSLFALIHFYVPLLEQSDKLSDPNVPNYAKPRLSTKTDEGFP